VKLIHYILDPVLSFGLRVKHDDFVDDEYLRVIFAYGGTHGLGAERGQQWGRYQLTRLFRRD
jgi:hypothetical protein